MDRERQEQIESNPHQQMAYIRHAMRTRNMQNAIMLGIIVRRKTHRSTQAHVMWRHEKRTRRHGGTPHKI